MEYGICKGSWFCNKIAEMMIGRIAGIEMENAELFAEDLHLFYLLASGWRFFFFIFLGQLRFQMTAALAAVVFCFSLHAKIFCDVITVHLKVQEYNGPAQSLGCNAGYNQYREELFHAMQIYAF
jgi:hypothetical protein